MKKLNTIIKKVVVTFLLIILLSGSLFPNVNTAYAQNNPDRTNGVQAATLEWIRTTALEIVSLYMARSWPIEVLNNSEPQWRKITVKDTDGRYKSDRHQRLIRWDRRPPNEILQDGFIPQIVSQIPNSEETNLYTYAKSNQKSIFVSTTKTQYKPNKYVWTPRSANSGIIYQYEIYAPGGVDVNESFSENSPWPNQMEVAFPGGIRPEFIRSVREMNNGRVQRVWINPNFSAPQGNILPEIATQSRTPVVTWKPNHPDGNHKDPGVKRGFNPDEDMNGAIGNVEEDTFKPDGNINTLPDGEYQIKSSIDQNVVIDVAFPKVQAYQNKRLDKQRWKFSYDQVRQAYTIESLEEIMPFQKAMLNAPTQSGKQINIVLIWNTSVPDTAYWRLIRTDDGYYQLQNLADLTKVIDLADSNTQNGTKINLWDNNGGRNQKWIIEPVDQPIIPSGIYTISTKLDYKKVIDHDEQSNKAMIWDFSGFNTSLWKFEYDQNKKAYKIRSNKYQNLGLYFQNKSFPVSVNNIDNNDNLRAYWTIEYDNQKGGYAIRSVHDPDQMLDLKNSDVTNWNEIITHQPTFGNNQLWNIVPSKE
ncbi:hypothetical protein COD78_32160 [Bacillus cereus]|uniref:scabin-related ADP-ribosyltransferase n=1 Tax=Bacillus cereus TaxID=1396 RepID=UPI000BFBBA2C|nr:RICIN domain-containing protein [Bacillus cereus]PGV16598.1 hypothetical protein COD78_32160 [Bacillus cereus]